MTSSDVHPRQRLSPRIAPTMRRALVLIGVIALALLPVAFLYGLDHRASPDLHAAVEMFGAVIAVIAGVTFLVRFGVLGAGTHLLFGLAFLANGATDFVHGVVPFLAERGWIDVPMATVDRIVPATYAAGRTMMVSLLLAALFVRRPLADQLRRRRLSLISSVGVVIASGVLTGIAFLLPVQPPGGEQALISRPADAIIGLAFLAAAFLLNRMYGRTGDALTWWVSLAAGVAAAGQFTVAVSILHDPLFDLAHVYKTIGYALPLLGLSLYHVRVISERDRYASQLERSNAAQKEFVSIVSHELRTPLAGIAGFGSLLEDDWEELTDEERSGYISEIVRQADRLNRLVNDLLTVARLGSEKWPLRLQSLEVVTVAKRAVDACGIPDIELVVPPGTRVVADADHLERVLLNLIDNAVKHGRPPIVVDAEDQGDEVHLRVRDHGPGVPQRFRDRLYAPFAQAESGTSRGSDGAGLGLAIVRGLVEAQGGTVRYHEPEGPGACFVVTLPAVAPSASDGSSRS